MEQFKEIFPKYHVSTRGNVKSFMYKTPRILKPNAYANSYLYVNIYIDGKPKQCRIHRLVAQAFIPNPDNKPFVNHINGIKTDNRVENLEWVTSHENNLHAYATGLKVAAQGGNSHSAKLTNEQARFIRENPNGLTTVELGRMFGVNETVIGSIQRGEAYRNAGGEIRKSNRVPVAVREEIRRLYAQGGVTQAALAKQFGVDRSTIKRIICEG